MPRRPRAPRGRGRRRDVCDARQAVLVEGARDEGPRAARRERRNRPRHAHQTSARRRRRQAPVVRGVARDPRRASSSVRRGGRIGPLGEASVLVVFSVPMARAHWLIKIEPSKYPFDKLVADGHAVWDGVRNFEARNNLRAMKKGDLCLYYHSNEGKAVVGVARLVSRGLSRSDGAGRGLERRRRRAGPGAPRDRSSSTSCELTPCWPKMMMLRRSAPVGGLRHGRRVLP